MYKHLLLCSLFFFCSSFFAMETSSAPKNRGCTNQLGLVLANFFEMAGRESFCRYCNHNTEKLKIIQEMEFNPTRVKGNVLLCNYLSKSSKQDLIVFARNLCKKKPGLYFLTSDNDAFAAAISPSITNISISAIIQGLKEKYGATNIISFADPDGYCFQGTLPTASTHLKKNLKTWME